MMNKLLGLYELGAAGIPAIEWKEYAEGSIMSDRILWTVRAALFKGSDYNLPRFVGVTAERAMEEASRLGKELKDKGMVIYYPYFTADKSGIIRISSSRTVIECVGKDLWNLTAGGSRDVTIIFDESGVKVSGRRDSLAEPEIDELMKYEKVLRGKYRQDIARGGELYLEWSYAYDCSPDGSPTGERYLVFYEMRIL
jgi:hypothetical protein